MTIFAVISGAESWEDIEDFGETHLDFLKQYGDFENGIPVHDTIARVVSCISPAKFHECRFNWSTQQLCENMGLRRFFE